VLEFTICNQGQVVDLTDQTISISFLKSDGTLVIQDFSSGVSILDATTGNMQCILTSQTLAVVGIVNAEIAFTDATGKRLSTAQFKFNVTESLGSGDEIVSISEIYILDNFFRNFRYRQIMGVNY